MEYTVRPFATVTPTEELSAQITPERRQMHTNSLTHTHTHTHRDYAELQYSDEPRLPFRCEIGVNRKTTQQVDGDSTGPVCGGERGGQRQASPLFCLTAVKWCDSMAGIWTRAAAACSQQVKSQNSSLA